MIANNPEAEVLWLLARWESIPGFLNFERNSGSARNREANIHGVFSSTTELRQLFIEHGPFDIIVDVRRGAVRPTANLWGWSQCYVKKNGLYIIADGYRRPFSLMRAAPDWASGTTGPLTAKDWQEIAVSQATASSYRTLSDGISIVQGERFLRVVSEKQAAAGGLERHLDRTHLETLFTLPPEKWCQRAW